MANSFVKAEKVVLGALAALEREVVLPNLVWLDAGGNFKGAKGDKIILDVPATTSARSRTMRSGTTRNRDELKEGTVEITLTDNLYKDVLITDEELTLDIRDFSRQVMSPIIGSMARGYEEEIADTMEAASYEHTQTWDASDPHSTLSAAGMDLTRSNVPSSGRAAVLGTRLALEFVTADQVRRADSAGDMAQVALGEATIAAPFAGFSRIVVSNAIDPNVGFAFHRTAYVASSQAPVTPAGAPWGATVVRNGLAMRALRAFDASADAWVDVLGFDTFIGSNTVKDHGAFDLNGKWVPAAVPDNSGGTDLKFIRAVKITAGSSS